MAYFKLAIFAVALCLILPTQALALPSSPTYTNGGEIRLNSQLQRPFDRAQRAINNCDEAEYNSAVNSIREQQEQLESQADDEPNEWRSQAMIDQAGQMAVNARAARAQLASAWAAKQPCGEQEEAKEEPQTETALISPTRPITVVGSSPELFDRAVNDATSQAQNAIAQCNQERFLDAMNWLDQLASAAATDADEADVRSKKQDLESRWNSASNKKTCQSAVYQNPFEFLLGAKIGYSHHGDLSGFVANETPGVSSTRAFEVIDPDNSGLAFGYDAELRIPLSWWLPNLMGNVANVNNIGNYMGFTAWDVFFDLSRMSTRLNEVDSMYSANGLDTLLPGVGGTGPSPAGYSIGAANGDITNINYKRDSDSTSFSAGIGQTLQTQSGVTLRPFGGLSYGHTNIDERFAGTTNAGTLNFAYESKISTHNTGGFIGLEAETRSETISRLFQSDFRLKGSLRLGYEYIDAKASDGLIVSGVLDQNNPVEVNDDGYFPNYTTSIGAVFLPNGLPGAEVEFGAAYERRPDSGTLTRDGTQDSNLSIESSDNFLGTIRTTFKF